MTERPCCKELELKRNQLAEEEKKFKLLFEHMLQEAHLWKIVRDESDNIKTWKLVDANAAALKSWGKSLEDVVGKTTDEIFPGVNATEKFLPIVQKVFSTREPCTWDSYFPGTDQHLQMVSVSTGEFFISSGKDIAPEIQTENELKETKINLKEAVAAANVGLWDWDLTTDKVNYSPEWKSQIGYKENEISDDYSEWHNRVHPDDLQAALNAVNASINSSGKRYEVEFRFRHKDGSYRWIFAHGSAIKSNGKPIRLVGSHVDITDRKQWLEEQVRYAQLAALGTVAAGVAHEINNPIQGILNYATLLKNKPGHPDRTVDISERIILESERIANITRDLLDFARDDHKKSVFSDICPLIKSAIALIEKKVNHQGIAIELNCSENMPITKLYPQGIQQVVINLIDNASDALQDKEMQITEKVIRVSCYVEEKDEDQMICLEVSDRGIGMTEDVLAKAKETFFSTKPSSRGTGLGLSIVNDIINRHNGQMEIESVAGEFTKVKVFLQIVEDVP